jgi:hypothetical protein
MSLLDAVERLAQRKKTKTKERSDDNKYITKTKKVEIPLEGNEKKTVTKTVTRPTMLGGANDKKVVTRDVKYSSDKNESKEIMGMEKLGMKEMPSTKERVELALKKKSYKYIPTGKAGEVKRVELP